MVTTIRRTARGYPQANGSRTKGFQTRPPFTPQHDRPSPHGPGIGTTPVNPPSRYVKPDRKERPTRKQPLKLPPGPGTRNPPRPINPHYRNPATPLPLGFGRARKVVYEMPRIPFGSPWDLARKVLPLLPMFDPQSPTVVTLPSGWVWCKGPVDPALPVCNPPTNWATKPWLVPGTCLLNVPLYGQGGTVLPAVPDATDFIWQFDNEYYAQRAYVDCIGTTTHTVVFGVAQRVSGTEVPFTDPGTRYNPTEIAPDHYGYGNPDTFTWPNVARPEPGKNPYHQIPAIKPSELGAVSERTERGYDIGGGFGAPAPLQPAVKPILPPNVKPHVPALPGPGVKERKLKVRGTLKAVYHFAQWITEAQDGLQAAYYAIPKEVRGHVRRTPAQQDLFVFQHINDIDLKKFLKNIINNEVQDAIYGTLGQARGKALRKLGVFPYTSWDTSGVPSYSRQAAGFENDIPKFTDALGTLDISFGA